MGHFIIRHLKLFDGKYFCDSCSKSLIKNVSWKAESLYWLEDLWLRCWKFTLPRNNVNVKHDVRTDIDRYEILWQFHALFYRPLLKLTWTTVLQSTNNKVIVQLDTFLGLVQFNSVFEKNGWSWKLVANCLPCLTWHQWILLFFISYAFFLTNGGQKNKNINFINYLYFESVSHWQA